MNFILTKATPMRTYVLLVSASPFVVTMPMSAQRSGTGQSGLPYRAASTEVLPLVPITGRMMTPTDATATDVEIAFVAGQSELTVRSRTLLNEMVDPLLREPMMRAVIFRPADAGVAEGVLAMRRADAKRAYLCARGIGGYCISVAMRGATAGTEAVPESSQADELRLTIVSDDGRTQPSNGIGRSPNVIFRIAE